MHEYFAISVHFVVFYTVFNQKPWHFATFSRKITPKKARNSRMMLFLSFKWLWQSLALSGIDEEKRKTQIGEIETLSNHYLAETP